MLWLSIVALVISLFSFFMARDNYKKAMKNFEKSVGMTYKDYIKKEKEKRDYATLMGTDTRKERRY